MKVKYACEVCGKEYDTPEGAKECEVNHENLKRKDALKAKSEEAIAEMVNKHVQTFKEFPSVELSAESQRIISKESGNALISVLTELFDVILGDDEDVEEE